MINELSIEDYSRLATKLKDCLNDNNDDIDTSDDDNSDYDDVEDDHLLIRAWRNKLSFWHLHQKRF